MKSLRAVVLLVIVPVMALAAAPPKAPPARMIPEDLAMAVLATMQVPPQMAMSLAMSSAASNSANAGVVPTPTVVVGRTTDEFPANVLPAGVKLLGGSADPARLAAYAMVESTAAEARTSVETQMTTAGWTRFNPSRTGGFMAPSPTAPWCSPDRASIMLVSIAARPAGGNYVTWMISRATGVSSACASLSASSFGNVMVSSPSGAMVPPTVSLVSVMPSLTAPEGITLSRTSTYGGSGSSFESSARATGKLAAAELLQKFSEQLQKAGWKARPVTLAEASAVQTLELRDPRGRVYAGLLVVTELGGTQDRDVSFRISDATP